MEDVSAALEHALTIWTQAELATILGVSHRTISRWAAGENEPQSFVRIMLPHIIGRREDEDEP